MKNINILTPTILEKGIYDTIRVLDDLNVPIPLKCEQIEIYSKAIFSNLLDVKKLTIEGLATFEGIVKAHELTIKGSAHFNNELQANVIKVINELKISHKLSVNHLELNGLLVSKEIDAASVKLNGTVMCQLLRSNKIEIDENANGRIEEMIGSSIKILPMKGQLTINKILAYEATLDHVDVDTIQAKIIHIGPNSKVKHINYL